MLEGGNKVAGFEQRVMGTGIQPGIAAPHDLYRQTALLQVDAIEVGNFQLATRGRLDALGDLDHLLVVEIQARDGVI